MLQHKNARTTPEIRRQLQESTESHAALARKFNIDVATVRKWRHREGVDDKVSRPKRVKSSLTVPQSLLILGLRKYLCLPLDDLLSVSKVLIKQTISRAVVNRLLQQQHISKMSDVLPVLVDTAEVETFKGSPIGTVQMMVHVVESLDGKRKIWVYSALERSTRCFYTQCFDKQLAIHPICFLQNLKEQPLISFGQVLLDESFVAPFNNSIKNNILSAFSEQGFAVRMMRMPAWSEEKQTIVLSETLMDSLPEVLTAMSDVYHHGVTLQSLGDISPSAKAMALRSFDQQYTSNIVDNVLRQIKSSMVTMSRVKKSLDKGDMGGYSLPIFRKSLETTGETNMANANEVVAELMKVEGAIAAVIADSDSGMVLAAQSNGFDTDSAAAGNTRVVQAKRDTMRMLGLNDKIEDILITLGTQLHLITPMTSNDAIFGYLVVDKKGANLGMARAQLKSAMSTLAI